MHTSKPSSRGTARSRPGESAVVCGGLRLAFAFLLSTWAVPEAAAQALLLEIHQDLTPYNLQSRRGVPISTIPNVPPGSDGRMTNRNESSGSVNLPTPNQFHGFLSVGGLPGLRSNDWPRLNDIPIWWPAPTRFPRR